MSVRIYLTQYSRDAKLYFHELPQFGRLPLVWQGAVYWLQLILSQVAYKEAITSRGSSSAGVDNSVWAFWNSMYQSTVMVIRFYNIWQCFPGFWQCLICGKYEMGLILQNYFAKLLVIHGHWSSFLFVKRAQPHPRMFLHVFYTDCDIYLMILDWDALMKTKKRMLSQSLIPNVWCCYWHKIYLMFLIYAQRKMQTLWINGKHVYSEASFLTFSGGDFQ